MSFDIDSFLARVVDVGASDIHLTVDERPMLRIGGNIVKIDMPKLSDEDMSDIIYAIIPDLLQEKINEFLDIDFSYEVKNVSRFRVNIAYQLTKPKLTIRVIPYSIKTPDDLGLPDYVDTFIKAKSGLVLVTGKTGSGKSTTLAALINEINKRYQKHILTLEDPVEFVFTNQKSVVTQRQIEIDTASFADGVKYALRQDPDVILVGEIRDQESVKQALLAAETGQLVFATLHTRDTIQTISRVINMFEPVNRDNIREQLADVLVGVISQKLILGTDKKRRHLACEILVNTPTIRDLIKKGQNDDIYEYLKTSTFEKMTTLNNSIYDLLSKGLIAEEDAIYNSEYKIELQQMIKGVYSGTKM